MSTSFLERLRDPRLILYDGGFGTERFARGVEMTNSSLACQHHPDTVLDVHQAYLKAGAELLLVGGPPGRPDEHHPWLIRGRTKCTRSGTRGA